MHVAIACGKLPRDVARQLLSHEQMRIEECETRRVTWNLDESSQSLLGVFNDNRPIEWAESS